MEQHLSRRFTETKISAEYDGPVLYAKDAMQGLELANRLQNEEDKEILLEELGIQQEKRENMQKRIVLLNRRLLF